MNKKGFVSLEVIFFSSFIFFLIFMLIGVFVYIYPTFSLQRDIYLLGKQAQKHGGLTTIDIYDFKDKISENSFIADNIDLVVIEGNTSPSGYGIIGVTDINYISKDMDEIMNIIVKIPSNNKVIKKFVKDVEDYYIFNISVSSEKY